MLRIIGLALLAVILWASGPAEAQSPVYCYPGSGSISQSSPCQSANPLYVTGTVTANSGATATAAAPSYSEGTSNPLSQNLSGDLRVIAKQSTSPWIVSGSGTAGTAATGVVTVQGIASMTPLLAAGTGTAGTAATGVLSIQGIASMTPVQVSGTGTFVAQVTLPTTPTIAAGNGVVSAPSAEALAALAPVVSTAAESNHVLKSGAGNLYGLTVTIGATTGYLMIFDATSLPSNGAVTPKYCYPIISNGTQGGASLSWATPARFSTGITAGFSSTGCFTLTASTTGNFFGQVD